MLPLLASLVIAAAGVAAIVVIMLTVQAQSAAVRQVMADSRAIARDREFLVSLISKTVGDAGSADPLGAIRVRPTLLPERNVNRAAALQPALQREAA